MFIALSIKKTIAPFGGAECYRMSTIKLSSAHPNGGD
jgi:hypothetical protein